MFMQASLAVDVDVHPRQQLDLQTYQLHVKSKRHKRSYRKGQHAAEIWRFLKSEMCFLRSNKNQCNEKGKNRNKEEEDRS
jgi:hypothetical protein